MGNINIKGCTSPNQDKKEGAVNKYQKNVPMSDKRNKEHNSRINDSEDVYMMKNKTNHMGDSKQQAVETDDTHMQSDVQFKIMEGTEKNKTHSANKSSRSSSKRKKYENKNTESENDRVRDRPKKDNSSRSKFYDEESFDEKKFQQNYEKKDNTKHDETNEKMILSQENTITNEQLQVSDTNQHFKKVDDDISSLKNEMKEIKEQLTNLTRILTNPTRMPRTVEYVDSKLEEIGCIQILQRGEGDFLDEIMEYLREVLRSCLNTDTFQPVLEICKRPSDVKKGDPLLVVCISSSRVVEDAEKAIKDVQELRRTLLLIFHMKEKHVLPVPKSKPQLTGQSFNNLGDVFDFAFTSEQGVYSCEMNESSKTKMIRFIKNFPVECTRF